jgi:hypothetical protein
VLPSDKAWRNTGTSRNLNIIMKNRVNKKIVKEEEED